MMTVGDLIRELQKFDPDARVLDGEGERIRAVQWSHQLNAVLVSEYPFSE